MQKSCMLSRTPFRQFLVPEIFLLRVALSAALVYATVAACAWLISDRMIFLPPPPSYRDTPDILKVPTADGERIAAVYLPNPGATYTLLLSHGNAEDLGWVLPSLPPIPVLGFGLFAYDYRGYGLSEGRPSEQHVYADIDAAYDYLTRELRVPAARIILYGRSLGAGAAVDLAARQSVGGLILESPFLAAFRVLTRIPLFPFDKFRNVDKIGRVRCPVLVMHGEADEIVPLWHGQRLFERAPGPKMLVVIPGAHHNDFMQVAGARYTAALRDFETLLRGH
jgi:fermentation-respiration switch protein FrsA (DUF1100 family)